MTRQGAFCSYKTGMMVIRTTGYPDKWIGLGKLTIDKTKTFYESITKAEMSNRTKSTHREINSAVNVILRRFFCQEEIIFISLHKD